MRKLIRSLLFLIPVIGTIILFLTLCISIIELMIP